MVSTTYRKAMREVSHSLNNAETALNRCEFPGPCQEAAMHSRIELIKELVTGAE